MAHFKKMWLDFDAWFEALQESSVQLDLHTTISGISFKNC